MNLTYAYNDARVKDAGPNGITVPRRPLRECARNKLGLWTRYDLPSINRPLASAPTIGQRVSLDGQTVKAYTADMSWKTTWKQWQFQANVKNLFDKVYAASGFIEAQRAFRASRDGCMCRRPTASEPLLRSPFRIQASRGAAAHAPPIQVCFRAFSHTSRSPAAARGAARTLRTSTRHTMDVSA